ncbi:hypothetical protein L218DRAFT_864014 [Marasmius fiardii PR-910]|nr:hypothetical protein L218DRAFT_864014 [Marasmius fiardii PR-910]
MASVDEDEEYDPSEDEEEGDLGVVGRGGQAGSGKRVDYDSDALDDDEDKPQKKKHVSTKRKRDSKSQSPSKKQSPVKKRRRIARDEDDDDDDLDLKEGQEVVGKVVQAPKTGRVPAGQISKNTLDFLSKLADPTCNDREWYVIFDFGLFKLTRALIEPVYRLAEQEWKDFVNKFTEVLIEADEQIPPLPPRDVIHRIYRDIRFSNDKTPYKRSFSASFSRSGRKGIFAGFRPGGESLIAGGTWCPGRNELATIRSNLMRNAKPFRDIISAPEFVEFFGEAKRQPNGERSNIFGAEDELKVAPKGVEKDHKDIDLLKCRSFAVVHRFLDTEVLEPDFNQKLADVARVLRPFVHCLNDLMTLQDQDEDDEDGDEDG